ncbi:MAG: hypothetical protein QM676_08785 [Novosphingobium sp.]
MAKIVRGRYMASRILAAASAGALLAASTAPVTAKPATYISGAMISEQRARTLRVMVAQSEIKSNINGSQLGTAILIAAGGGMLAGLIGGLVSAAQNAEREKQAEALIGPVRTAMADFDADELARSSAKSGFANVAWLSDAQQSFGKDSSPAGKSSYLDQAGEQVVFVEFSYDLSPDFDSIRVMETVQIANKALPRLPRGITAKPEHRLTRYLVYTQTVTSAVLLPDADPKNKQANADRWAANGGELARHGVAQAFERLVDLTPRMLALTPAEVKDMNDKTKPRASFGGLSGRLVSQDDKGMLIWAKQFIAVQSMRPAPVPSPSPAPVEDHVTTAAVAPATDSTSAAVVPASAGTATLAAVQPAVEPAAAVAP